MFDEDGVNSMNTFGNFKDDGSINSKQRLALLIQMYNQYLENYKSQLSLKHEDEKDYGKKQMLIEQELAIYTASLWNRFFPEISALEQKIALDEKKKGKGNLNAAKTDEKKKDEKKDEKKDDKKTDEKSTDEQKPSEPKTEKESEGESEKSDDSDGKPKTKTQQLIEKFDKDLKAEGINFDKFTAREGFDIEALKEEEVQELSGLVKKGLKISTDKAEANDNPGWLLIYLKKVYPTLAKLLPPATLFEISDLIMDGYVKKNHNISYKDLPQQYQDLKHDDRFKDKPIKEKMALAGGIVAREMSFGHIQETSAPNTLTYLLESVPFPELERGSNKESRNESDIDQRFNAGVNLPPPPKEDPSAPKAPKAKEEAPLYYMYDGTPYHISEQQVTRFEQFLYDQLAPKGAPKEIPAPMQTPKDGRLESDTSEGSFAKSSKQ